MSSPSTPTPAGKLEPFEIFPGTVTGAIDRVYLHHTTVAHTLSTADAFDRGMRRMNRLYGHRYVLIYISNLSRASSLPEDVRGRFIATLRTQTILPCTGAMAFLSTGLIGATGRAIVTGILLAVRLPFLVRVFANFADAYQFVARESQRDGLSLPGQSDVETALFDLARLGEQALRSAKSG